MSTTVSEGVRVIRDGDVAIVTLDRPARKNALNAAMFADLARAASDLAEALPRAVVITGAGQAAFCAGMDVNPDNPHIAGLMSAVQTGDRAPVAAMLGELHAALDRLFALPVPLIAAINGIAYGGGAELAMRCDLRVIDPAATVCFSEVRLGLMPDWGGGVALTRLIGPARAAHMILLARKVGAAEALALGAVNAISEPGGAVDAARELARAIAANGPRAVRGALRVIRETPGMAPRDAIAHELDLAIDLIAGGECVHGITAFMTRQPAVFPEPE